MKKTPTSPEILNHLNALIQKHGGMAKLAREIGTNGPVVQMWVRRQSVTLPWQQILKKMKA
jgi:hypothetical protein